MGKKIGWVYMNKMFKYHGDLFVTVKTRQQEVECINLSKEERAFFDLNIEVEPVSEEDLI